VRPDAPPKVTGEFVYSNDLQVPGMLFGATVRSPHAHARIVQIQSRDALLHPGAIAAFTIEDVPGDRLIGHITADQPVFADRRVRYHGEPVAFAVAESREAATTAAAKVDVSYEPVPALTDPEQALAENAPLVHESGNVIRRLHLRRGGATAGAAVEVQGFWEVGRQDQAFLAPESALAIPDPDGGVTLHVATQDVHTDRRQIAAAGAAAG